MKRNFFDVISEDLRIRPENIFFPDPCDISSFGKVINELGGVDIAFGGIGINGHLAFNEPMKEESITTDDFLKLKTRILRTDNDTVIVTCLKYGG